MGYWMTHIPAYYVICIAVGIFLTLICLTLSIVHLYFVYNHVSIEAVQTDMYWLVFMCPIIAVCGAIGMVVPRTATFLYAVALVYFMLCIFTNVSLMLTLHGGRQNLVKKLLARNKKVNMRIFPLGCCLFCVPKLKPTDRVFRRIEWLVFQSPLLRIFLEILNLIVFMEVGNRVGTFFQITNALGMISLFVASWGSYMIIPLGGYHLKPYKFTLMFHIVDTAQLIYSIQKVVFDFCAGVDWIQSDGLITASSKAQFWMSFLLTLEMFSVSIVSTFIFRPSQTAFFDKFTKTNHNRLSSNHSDDGNHKEISNTIQRPMTSDSVRTIGQIEMDGNINGIESGIDSASTSSQSIYNDSDGAYRDELDRIRDESVTESGLEIDERKKQENFTEINLNSARIAFWIFVNSCQKQRKILFVFLGGQDDPRVGSSKESC
uniref:Uncharacterized protein n=1 Tax=Panagrolaimus sp. JU765 TaxID=591449 RepID=A0AC34RJD7_9BILA